MSPIALRRFRAERLLRDDFERLRERVIASVSARLRACGAELDASDLEACYAMAWQGLYAAVLEGTQVANPPGWLVLVTYRRAIDEQRARRALACAEIEQKVDRLAGTPIAAGAAASGRDLADELDDRARLRQLFEALRGRLSEREREAATLCYLQGLSRAQAAARMGVSETRMRKLMEGGGAGSPGVAGKVGGLVRAISAGQWCEEQGSLMRALAYGILDPAGERYQLALIHRDECPACRAYVLSLRGLAALLPPVPVLMQWLRASAGGGGVVGAGVAAHAGGSSGCVAAAPAGAGPGATAATGVAQGATGPGMSAGTLSVSGAAGAGVAGSGWWLAGPLGTKLAVGCLLALGVGFSCAALDVHSPRWRAPGRQRVARRPRHSPSAHSVAGTVAAWTPIRSGPSPATLASARVAEARSRVVPAAQASREFGLEQPGADNSAGSRAGNPIATSASTAPRSGGVDGVPHTPAQPQARTPSAASAASPRAPAAVREFSPG